MVVWVFNASQSRRHSVLGLHSAMSWRLELKFAIKELSKLRRTSWVELSALERTAEANVWCHANWNFSFSLNLVEKLFYAARRRFIELSQYAQTRSKEMRAKLVWNPKKLTEMRPPKWNSHLFSIFLSAPQHNFLSVLVLCKRTVKSMNDDDGKQNLDWIFTFSHFSSRRSERNRLKPRSDTFIFSSFYFALFASILD